MLGMLRYFLSLKLMLLVIASHALPSDQQQLIKIQADNLFHDEKKGLTRYQGDVVMQQGSLKIEADKVEFKSDKSGNMQSLTATGQPAKFQQQPQIQQAWVKGRAKTIQYQIDNDKISFSGAAFIQQGEAQLNSENITYILNDQVFKAEQSQSNNSSDKPQRVEMIIPPKKKPQKDIN